jgi:acetyl esterase
MRVLADAALAGYVAELRAHLGPPAREVGVDALRAAAEQRAAIRPAGPRLEEVRDLTVPGTAPIPARLYRPSRDDRPLVVYFHGGGWIFGDLSSHDRMCRRLATAADVAILAVDYRRAPEHPWPAAVQDGLAVLRWLRSGQADVAAGSGLAVAGDSAGATIAALTCLWLRDAGERQPDLQVLAYPHTDLTFAQPSVEAKAHGWGLDADDARWFAEQWVPDSARRADPRVSPLLEPDLTGLAPALIVTAEHDPLRDEGNAYAAALEAVGGRVTHRCERGQVHGFINLDAVSGAAVEAGGRLWGDVKNLLHQSVLRQWNQAGGSATP